ncbi:hypothetical protein [Xanthomonas indica]|uniref:Uncharacterized protein n=1 Tax=Xanthomonas indica TaxID=2912242 RepID=A0AAU8I6X5_9XANT|nr:hypothetical protein [Xanthomonas indica]MCI2260603.1 hypothetical protein [Xanthomonas indica]
MQAFVIGLLALVACAGAAFVLAVVFPSRLVLWLLLFTSTTTFLCLLCVDWFLRDGLGPDAVTSQGMEAALRVADSAWLPALCWALLNGSAHLVYRWRRRKRALPAPAFEMRSEQSRADTLSS